MMYDDNIFPFTSANFIWKKNNCSMAINYWFYIENNVWVTSIFTTVSVDTYCISGLFCFSLNHCVKAMIDSYFFPLLFHSSWEENPEGNDPVFVNCSMSFCFLSVRALFLSSACRPEEGWSPVQMASTLSSRDDKM